MYCSISSYSQFAGEYIRINFALALSAVLKNCLVTQQPLLKSVPVAVQSEARGLKMLWGVIWIRYREIGEGCDVTFLLLVWLYSLPLSAGGRQSGGDGCRSAVVSVNPWPRRKVVVACLFSLWKYPHVCRKWMCCDWSLEHTMSGGTVSGVW